MHEDALAAVLFRADGDWLPLAHLARLRHHQVAGRVEHDDAVHPGQAGPTPGAGRLDVGRQVGGGKKPSGRTPSAGAGSKRATGAPASGGASKLGGRYWNRGRVVTGTLIIRAPNPVTQRPLQK